MQSVSYSPPHHPISIHDVVQALSVVSIITRGCLALLESQAKVETQEGTLVLLKTSVKEGLALAKVMLALSAVLVGLAVLNTWTRDQDQVTQLGVTLLKGMLCYKLLKPFSTIIRDCVINPKKAVTLSKKHQADLQRLLDYPHTPHNLSKVCQQLCDTLTLWHEQQWQDPILLNTPTIKEPLCVTLCVTETPPSDHAWQQQQVDGVYTLWVQTYTEKSIQAVLRRGINIDPINRLALSKDRIMPFLGVVAFLARQRPDYFQSVAPQLKAHGINVLMQ